MLDKPLMNLFPESKREISANVFYQWIGLLLNIFITFAISSIIFFYYDEGVFKETSIAPITLISAILFIALPLKYFVTIKAGEKAFLSSASIKAILREKIYQKMVKLGGVTPKDSSMGEVLQVLVEGVEQLELYFSGYVPQLFYSLLAPLTLFIVVAPIDFQVAGVLFLCVPFIPIAIVVVQKLAKKLFYKYWGEYTSLGDLFLENLHGLSTLKIYDADQKEAEDMHTSAENFRKITMSVLKSQLNSIIVMDVVAYGGAALGMILASLHLSTGKINPWEATIIILLSAEFFLPMRRLGAFFHVSMNGMAASKKIFRLLEAEVPQQGTELLNNPKGKIAFENVIFYYEKSGDQSFATKNINVTVEQGQLISLVGKSGSGKSTLAKLLRKEFCYDQGRITIGGQEITNVNAENLNKSISYIPYQSYIFSGTVRENMKLAKSNASDTEISAVLNQVNLNDFLEGHSGLDTYILAGGSNLSGGQKQRLAMAMAILRESDIYIFDEATSQVDSESEEIMIEQIYKLAKKSAVIMISHSLKNCVDSHCIYVLNQGECVEFGSHSQLIEVKGDYAALWKTQEDLLHYEK
ncbi:MAG: ABC transporter ATP-binding protein/permease [Eubacteriales bacterium]